MPDLVVTKTLVIPAAELSWAAVRASGPGGQNVNKVATKVELCFDLPNTTVLPADVKARLRSLARHRLDAEGRLRVVDQTTRNQSQNRRCAEAKLCELIEAALVRPKTRKPTRPSKAAKRRRLEQKQHQSQKKRGRGRISNGD